MIVECAEVDEVNTDQGAFGASTQKRSLVWSSHKNIDQLHRRVTVEDKQRIRAAGVKTAKRYVDKTGRARCCGSKALKSTQPVPQPRVALNGLSWLPATICRCMYVRVCVRLLHAPRTYNQEFATALSACQQVELRTMSPLMRCM
jgi:hypothetical protein